jgi:hypothetical protein
MTELKKLIWKYLNDKYKQMLELGIVFLTKLKSKSLETTI